MVTELAAQIELGRVSRNRHARADETILAENSQSSVVGNVLAGVMRITKTLADGRQVLCVTHLPQVASQAHAHMKVEKGSDGKTTRTGIVTLTRDDRVDELARMLGGVKVSEKTRAAAREMLED